jgi:hypothetical protein
MLLIKLKGRGSVLFIYIIFANYFIGQAILQYLDYYSSLRRIKSQRQEYPGWILAVKIVFQEYFDQWDKYYFSDLVLFASLHDIVKNPEVDGARETVEAVKTWLTRNRDMTERFLLDRLSKGGVATESDLVPYINSYLRFYNLRRNTDLSRPMLENIYAKMADTEEYGFLLLIFESVANALKN